MEIVSAAGTPKANVRLLKGRSMSREYKSVVWMGCFFALFVTSCISTQSNANDGSQRVTVVTEIVYITETPIPTNTVTITPTITPTPTNTLNPTVSPTPTISPNSPPKISINIQGNVLIGSEIVLDASDTWDVDNDEISFTWEQNFYTDRYRGTEYITGHDANLQNVSEPIARFTPQFPGNYRFTLRAFDKDGGSEEIIEVFVPITDSPFEMRGIALEHWFYRDSRASMANNLFAQIALNGGNLTELSPTWYMESATSNTMFPCPISPIDFDRCRGVVSDSKLIEMIRAAHSEDLEVMLKPQLLIAGKDGPEYSGDIQPLNWNEWFVNWTDVVVHYAIIAESEKVEILQIGNELVSSLIYTTQWRNLIDQVRQVYSGKLSYADNSISYGPSRVSFWDDLDYIGVSFWPPATGAFGVSETKYPTVEEMSHVLNLVISRNLDRAVEKFQIPVIITEIGTANYDGTNITHFEYAPDADTTTDNGEQSLYYEAAFRVFASRSYIKGVTVWAYTFEDQLRPTDWTMSPLYKPSEEVIRVWFGVDN